MDAYSRVIVDYHSAAYGYNFPCSYAKTVRVEDIVGIRDIADRVGLTRGYVALIKHREGFSEPITSVSGHPVSYDHRSRNSFKKPAKYPWIDLHPSPSVGSGG